MPPGPWRTLVDARTLHAALADPGLVLLDCQHSLQDPEAGPAAWRKGHLPGAWHTHVDRDLSSPPRPDTGRHPLPGPAAFRAAGTRWGIGAGVQVVAYDDDEGVWASRAWWLLRDFGHGAVAVLDGGLQAWAEEGFALAQDAPRRGPAAAFGGQPGHMPVVAAGDLPGWAPRRLLDARSPERYRGEQEPIDPVAGHIPGARNVPSAGNTDQRGRFLRPDALRARYAPAVGERAGGDVAVYCGSGVTATHDILALEIAGWPGARLYPGSWSEWIRDPARPVARGPAP